jgi:gliding motility-associated-like protein
VSLEVITDVGCTNSYSDSISIFRLPEPVISADNGCLTDPVAFTDISDSSLTSTITWLWNFGDGNSSSTISPIHFYQAAGTYTVTLTSSTANGCTAAANLQLEIYPVPEAGFFNGSACAGNAVEFTNTSTISSGAIAGYQWFFGDSTLSNDINPVHVYTHPGVYAVLLIAGSNYGCIDTAWGQVTVFENPVTNFTFDNPAGCGPLTIHFTDSSYVPGNSIASWSWNFGDGTSDTVPNPVHVYASAGSYPVSLNVLSADGCTGSFTINNAIEIYPDPVAGFTPDPYVTTILQPVYFENQSTGATAYQWNFGDGYYSDSENPQHLYNDTGQYVIYLTAVNQYGCEDTAINEVIMTPTFTVYIPNAFTPNNDGMNEFFTVSGIGIKNYELFIWNRWGNLIFEGDNCGWNGKVLNRDESAKEDVYIYRVVFKDIFNQNHQLDGRVNLIR